MRLSVYLAAAFGLASYAHGETPDAFPGCYDEQHLAAADVGAKTVSRYGTLYSGGDFNPHRDNVHLSIRLYRLLNGLPPDIDGVDATNMGNRIWDSRGYRSRPKGEDHLRAALDLALATDADTYQAVLTRSGLEVIPSIDLDLYTSPRLPADWWLIKDAKDLGDREAVTARIARGNKLLDWLQTASASSATPWALNAVFAPAPALRAYEHQDQMQRRAVFDHAYGRWKRGDGSEWAALALELSPPAPLPRDWGISDKTNELRQHYSDLNAKTARCRATPEEIAAFMAMSLSVDRRDLYTFREAAETTAALDRTSALRPYINEYVSIAELADMDAAHQRDKERWLATIGSIRRAFSIRQEEEFAAFFLAENLDEVIAALNGSPVNFDGAYELLDLVSYRQLRSLAENDALSLNWRRALAKAAFIRAYMLRNDQFAHDMIPLLAELHPALADELEPVLQARGDREKKRRLTLFLLRHPGFNHTVGARSGRYGLSARPLDLTEVSTFQHSAANWWCAGDPYTAYINRIKDGPLGRAIMEKSTFGGRYYSKRNPPIRRTHSRSTGHFHVWHPPMDDIINRHPLMKLVDLQEVDALSKAVSGPERLSREAITWAREDSFRRSIWLGDRRVPEALHLAVRTTRWGCQRQGGHTAYSREAFRLLHQEYGRTDWAEKTPYWFDASHFSHQFRPEPNRR